MDFSFIPRKKDRFRFEPKLPAFKKLERKKLRGVWVVCVLYFTTTLLNEMIRSSPVYLRKKIERKMLLAEDSNATM